MAVSSAVVTSCWPEENVLANLDQVALYTVKRVKRIVKSYSVGQKPPKEQMQHLIDVVEFNLNRLGLERSWYFHTIRDYSRVFHDEWHQLDNGINVGHICYNSILLVIALKLGLEKLWMPDGPLPFNATILSEYAAVLYPNSCPVFALKHLDQLEGLFDYFAKYSADIQSVSLPLSDNNTFLKCVKFVNLRVIELAGGVADKVLCNALWNVGSKKSDKVLEMALKDSKNPMTWQIVLPHLEVLRNNVLKTETQMSAMRVALGAAALALQPKMATVESLLSWGTSEAILYLLDMEAKHKNTQISKQKFEVNTLTVHYEEKMDFSNLKKIVAVCPKLSHLKLFNTKNIHPDLSWFVMVIPVQQLKQLTVDAFDFTELEFTVIVTAMKNLEHLTLRVTPMKILDISVPSGIPYDEARKLAGFPSIKTLVLEFLPETESVEDEDPYKLAFDSCHAVSLINFLSVFSSIEEVYFRNTVTLPPSFLVFGCFGGALAVLQQLTHISIISCPEDVPNCLPMNHPLLSHFVEVQKMLPDIQEEVTFKHLEKLKSIEIDEFYLSTQFDKIIKALRLSGVYVSVLYRKGMKL